MPKFVSGVRPTLGFFGMFLFLCVFFISMILTAPNFSGTTSHWSRGLEKRFSSLR